MRAASFAGHGRGGDSHQSSNFSPKLRVVPTLFIGILLCLVIAVGEPYGVGVVRGSPMCADYSTGAALFLFFLLTAGNLLLRHCCPAISLTAPELAIIYAMMLVACAIPSWGLVMNFIAMVAGVTYFANESNQWHTLIHPYLRKHLIPTDADAVRLFFEGARHGQSIPWHAWIGPLSWWFSFAIVFFLVQIALVALLRRQWMDNERLQFPLVQLPLEMIRTDAAGRCPLFHNTWMWIGFALPMAVNSLNALNARFPAVPPIKLNWGFPLLRGSVWLPFVTRFEVLGLSYLLSADVSLSLWLFAVLRTVEVGIYRLLALNREPAEIYSDPGTPPVAYQGLGAMMALVALVLHRALPSIRAAFNCSGSADAAVRAERQQTRLAAVVALAGLIFLWWWLCESGMTWTTALGVLFFTVVIFTGLTRIVAQGGIAYGRPPVPVPAATLSTLGTNVVGREGLVALGLSLAWGGDVRTSVMASSANGLRITGDQMAARHWVYLSLILASLVTLFASACGFIYLACQKGGVTLGGWATNGLTQANIGWVTNAINAPSGVRWDRIAFMGVGAGTFFLLSFLRDRFFWFPLHPIGLALGLAGPFQWNWFPICLAWLIKVVVLRYWGSKGYLQTRPLFLGLILGNFVSAGLWLIICALTGIPGRSFTGG